MTPQAPYYPPPEDQEQLMGLVGKQGAAFSEA